MKRIQYLYIRFENRLSTEELMILAELISNKFRDKSMLFLPDPNRYPLIQYKLIWGRLCIVCLGEGADDVNYLLQSSDKHFQINDKEITLSVEDFKIHYFILQSWDTVFNYRIDNWIPFENKSDYNSVIQVDNREDRMEILQNMMSNNIASFYQEFGCEMNDNLKIDLTSSFRLNYSADNQLSSFSFTFTSNLSIPQHCGIGASTMFGNGIISRRKIINHI